MTEPREVSVPRRPVEQLGEVIGPERLDRLATVAERFRGSLAGRIIWNVNSTASGGGVAEMLGTLLGYGLALGVDLRWLVIGGDAEFFAVTKRLHNRVHGLDGPGGLGSREAEHYARVLAGNLDWLLARVRPGDLVLLHDPQTAGLAAVLRRHGVRVVWRCHIGADHSNDRTEEAWRFLRPHLDGLDGYVFSRPRYRPAWVPAARTWIVPPSIDPLAPKNQELDAVAVAAILGTIGVLDGASDGQRARFVRGDGSADTVRRIATVVAEELPGLGERAVLQVSRWDRLKDMAGVLSAFADHLAPTTPGWLVLAGPDVTRVSDDPEGAEVYAQCVAAWRALPAAVRRRVLLVTLPLDDVDENAAMVNALQRWASVVTQKSLAEGFGLTVAEAMWKARPVVGGAVGGIQDQIVDGTGLLVDPTDLPAFGAALRGLLTDPAMAAAMGAAARTYVRREYVGDVHLLRYAELFDTMIGDS